MAAEIDSQSLNSENSADDEISLLDLLAVLLRYRKFIVIFTGIVTALAIVVLFVLPLVIPSFNSKKYEVQYKIMTAEMPETLRTSLGIAASNSNSNSNVIRFYSQENFTNLQFLASEYKNYPIFSTDIEKIDEYSYNNMIQKMIQDKSFEAKIPLANDYFVFIVTPKAENLEMADKLVKDMTEKTNVLLKNMIFPRLKELRTNTESSLVDLQKSFTGATDVSTIARMQSLIQVIDSFDARYPDLVYITDEPFVISQSQGRVKKLIIVFFAAFFVSIFIAFARNAVENIKKDPEANKLMTDAWNAGK